MYEVLKRIAYRLFPTLIPQAKTEQRENSDIFFVDDDGAISLNYDSEIVRKAFADNIERLRKGNTNRK